MNEIENEAIRIKLNYPENSVGVVNLILKELESLEITEQTIFKHDYWSSVKTYLMNN